MKLQFDRDHDLYEVTPSDGASTMVLELQEEISRADDSELPSLRYDTSLFIDDRTVSFDEGFGSVMI